MRFRSFTLHEAVSAFKRRLVLKALAATGGNRSRAALALKIERTSLLRLIRELGLADSLPNGRRGRPRSPRNPEGWDSIGSTVDVASLPTSSMGLPPTARLLATTRRFPRKRALSARLGAKRVALVALVESFIEPFTTVLATVA